MDNGFLLLFGFILAAKFVQALCGIKSVSKINDEGMRPVAYMDEPTTVRPPYAPDYHG